MLIWGRSADVDVTSGGAAWKKLISGVSWEQTEPKPKVEDCVKAFTPLENMSRSSHGEEWCFMLAYYCCG